MAGSSSSSSVVRDPSQQPKSICLVETESSELQEVTEGECRPFFVDLATLSRHSLEHLRDTGLLPPPNNNNDDEKQEENDLKLCLLREKHLRYLSRVFLPSEQPLGYSLVSLDASRPWMLYWTLHGTDLMLLQPPQQQQTQKEEEEEEDMLSNKNDDASTDETSLLYRNVGDDALCAVVSTLQACWQSIETTVPTQHLTLTPKDQELLEAATTIISGGDDTENNTANKYNAGGFGGGPGQMAHCAVSYAAVLTLCIVATASGPNSAPMAWKLLERIRKPIYAWMLSLQQANGGFRMHHDGEVDVRASYTIFCIAKLLNILTPTLASPSTIEYIASCQTFEGGFGGEPFSEAHGGYAYCAVAALQLVDRLDKATVDMDALLGWLARRQMSYEGGFCGRSNKLVDGCYSFWQGGAMAIVSATHQYHFTEEGDSSNDKASPRDPWLPAATPNASSSEESSPAGTPLSYALLFDKPMLQRYILLCAQDVNGGLRDKPSKPRDFYHSCYNLSGLAVTQHCGSSAEGIVGDNFKDDNFGHPEHSRVAATHPCYNIRVARVQQVLDHFKGES